MRIKLLCHSVWDYLNQPVFDGESDSQWRPSRFWYLYKLKMLEKCWQKQSATTTHNKY